MLRCNWEAMRMKMLEVMIMASGFMKNLSTKQQMVKVGFCLLVN